jgi:carboxyl-terminal processing protease
MCGEAQSLTVERQQDVRSPVYYRLEHSQDSGQRMGYIHLREFNALAKRDLVTAMKRLQDAGATSYLLDLQDNPGGLVQVLQFSHYPELCKCCSMLVIVCN